jgi:hypothetical protein
LVRAASAADVFQLLSPSGPFTAEVMGPAALYAGQSVLMFAFAATAIEVGYCCSNMPSTVYCTPKHCCFYAEPSLPAGSF